MINENSTGRERKLDEFRTAIDEGVLDLDAGLGFETALAEGDR